MAPPQSVAPLGPWLPWIVLPPASRARHSHPARILSDRPPVRSIPRPPVCPTCGLSRRLPAEFAVSLDRLPNLRHVSPACLPSSRHPSPCPTCGTTRPACEVSVSPVLPP